MKLYIAISSLNLDNILSSESISPSWYYKERNFGGNFFEPIKNLDMTDRLILFSVKPKFTIDDSEREQNPIVIEIEDDKQLNIGKLDEIFSNRDFAIYTYDRTIILTPWNCRILFFDIESLKIADNQSQGSRNDKLGEIFPKKLITGDIILSKLASKIPQNIGKRYIFDDTPFNVAKGCLWGYLLGLKMSIDPDSAKLLSIANNIRNIASSAISNDGECKPQFYDKLRSLDREYREIGDKDINTLWYQETPKEEADILKKHEVYEEALHKFHIKKGYKSLRAIPFQKTSKEVWIEYREAVNNYTENRINEKKNRIDTALSEIFTYSDNILSIKGYPIINKFLTFVSSRQISRENIRIDRLRTDTFVTTKILPLVQEKVGVDNWDKNPAERLYLNNLFFNLRDFKPFDFNSIGDIELKSIAAILLKGEDYDALVRYLQDNDMTDYRFVMSLWGALEGYVSISKVLLKELLTPNNISNVNYLLWGMSKHKTFPEFTIPVCQPDQKLANSTNKIKNVTVNPLADLYEEFPTLKKYNSDLSRILQETTEINANFYSKVADALKGKKGIGQIKKWIQSRIDAKKHKKLQLNIFQTNNCTDNSFLHFAFDKEAWNKIKDLVPIESREKLFSDYDWFMREMRKRPQDRNYYQSIDSSDDKRVIESFVTLKAKPNKNGRNQAPYFTPEVRSKIRERLLSLYCK